MDPVTYMESISPEALEPYAGKWVAIRDLAVVASADSLDELRRNPDVVRDDAVYVVPGTWNTLF